MQFPIRKIFWILTSIATLLLAVYTFNILSIHFLAEPLPDFFLARFDINGEANVPAWFSTILLFSVSAAAFVNLYFIPQTHPQPRAWRTFWQVLLVAFCLFSLDEAAVLHELIDIYTRGKWVFYYAPVGILFFAYCGYYWMKQRKTVRQPGYWILAGLALFFIGAGVLEWVSYQFYLPYAARHVEYALEEGMEMLGTILVLVGSLKEFNRLISKET